MKKLLTTTALVALVASVASAETKVGGSLQVTITDAETASTGAKESQGTAIGYEHELDMKSSKELDNGWTSTIHTEGINDDATAGLIDDVSLKLSNGDTTLYVGQDDMTAFDINMTPKVFELEEDNATQSTIINSGDGTIHDTNAFGVSQKVGDGSFTFLYSPDTSQDSANGDNTVGSGGGSGYEVGYKGKVGGLSFGVAYAEDKPAVDTGNDSGESTIVTASYTMDAISVGFSQTDDDNAGTTDDVKTTYLGATYAVSDAMSVGIQFVTGDDNDAAEDEEVTQFDVGYDLGGLMIYAYHSQAENVGGVANTDADGWGIKLHQSF
jgi:hypothetical protein